MVAVVMETVEVIAPFTLYGSKARAGPHTLASLADHFLLRSQQNAVFAIVREAGFDPGAFEWQQIDTRATSLGFSDATMHVPMLVHKPSNAVFVFDFDARSNDHYATLIPGREKPEDFVRAGSWSDELRFVEKWLGYVKREFDSPNLWDEFEQARTLVVGATEIENSSFTADEQAQIAAQMHELKEFVRANYELNTAQMIAIERRLDYLSDAAGRIGRLDWRNLLVGALLGLVVTAMVPPEPVRDVLGIIIRTLGHLFGGGLPELRA